MFGSRWLLLGVCCSNPRGDPQGFSADGCPVGPGSGSDPWWNGSMGEKSPAYKWVMNWGYNLRTIDPNFLPVPDILPCIVSSKDGQVQMTFSSYEMEDAIVEDEAFLWWVFCQLVLGRKGAI